MPISTAMRIAAGSDVRVLNHSCITALIGRARTSSPAARASRREVRVALLVVALVVIVVVVTLVAVTATPAVFNAAAHVAAAAAVRELGRRHAGHLLRQIHANLLERRRAAAAELRTDLHHAAPAWTRSACFLEPFCGER